MKLLVFLSCLLFALAACSSPKTCKYEKEYNATVDSLRKYPPIVSTDDADDAVLTDLTKLSCSDYMEKYKLNDKDLKLILETAEITWSISSTFQSIEDNLQLIQQDSIEMAEEFGNDSIDYSFHQETGKSNSNTEL